MSRKTDGGYEIDEKDREEMEPEEEREMPEGLETYTGYCRFCGQAGIIHALPGWDEDQVNEAATTKCGCEKAQEYAKQKEQITKAKKRITELFGEGAEGGSLDDGIVQNLISFVDIIATKKMQSVTVNIGRGLKANVSRMAKGSIKVERAETLKTSFEE